MLGDSAYPLLTNLLTPYRDNGHLSPAAKYFNKVLNTCRVYVEHTFGLLKQRFRQLYYLRLKSPESICNFIIACCILHNLALGDGFASLVGETVDDDSPPCTERSDQQATKKRDNLCQLLYNSRCSK